MNTYISKKTAGFGLMERIKDEELLAEQECSSFMEDSESAQEGPIIASEVTDNKREHNYHRQAEALKVGTPEHTFKPLSKPPRCGGGREETLFYKDFTTGISDDEMKLSPDSDGKTEATERGMIIKSLFTSSNINRECKLQLSPDRVFDVRASETIAEVTLSAFQSFNAERPVPDEFRTRIRNIHADYRLCCSALSVYDTNSSIYAMFLLTNDAIYAYYERKPSNEVSLHTCKNCLHCGETECHASFASAVLVQMRGFRGGKGSDMLDDFYRLGIGIDGLQGHINWYIDRRLVYSLNRIGYRLPDQYQVLERGGAPHLVSIESVRIGVGHYSFLDHQLPNNYAREMIFNDTSSDPNCPIPRSESGLVMINEKESYREILPDIFGRHGPIVPETSFAVPSGGSNKYRAFGQGVISCVRCVRIFERLPEDSLSKGDFLRPLTYGDIDPLRADRDPRSLKGETPFRAPQKGSSFAARPSPVVRIAARPGEANGGPQIAERCGARCISHEAGRAADVGGLNAAGGNFRNTDSLILIPTSSSDGDHDCKCMKDCRNIRQADHHNNDQRLLTTDEIFESSYVSSEPKVRTFKSNGRHIILTPGRYK